MSHLYTLIIPSLSIVWRNQKSKTGTEQQLTDYVVEQSNMAMKQQLTDYLIEQSNVATEQQLTDHLIEDSRLHAVRITAILNICCHITTMD